MPPPSFQQCGLRRVADELLLRDWWRAALACNLHLMSPPHSDSQTHWLFIKGHLVWNRLHPLWVNGKEEFALAFLPRARGRSNWSNIDSVCMKGTHGNQCVVEFIVFQSSLKKHTSLSLPSSCLIVNQGFMTSRWLKEQFFLANASNINIVGNCFGMNLWHPETCLCNWHQSHNLMTT